jgi:hypothetical protein
VTAPQRQTPVTDVAASLRRMWWVDGGAPRTDTDKEIGLSLPVWLGLANNFRGPSANPASPQVGASGEGL